MTKRWPQTFAFVVQFPDNADPQAGAFEGRIEHVSSGRVAQFAALDDLRAFVTEVLKEVRSKNSAAGGEPP